MKKTLSLLFALVFIATGLNAQIRIVAAYGSPGVSGLDVIRWNADTGVITDTVATTAQGIVFGSSVFDAFNQKYYFGDGSGMHSVGINPNASSFLGGTMISTSAEVDMATGKIVAVGFEYVYDSIGTFLYSTTNFVQHDINNGTDSIIGQLTGCLGIYADASCYNSNLGIYYFFGIDSLLGECLYAVNTYAPAFSLSKVPVTTPNLNIMTLEYDNEFNIMYALSSTLGATGNLQIQQINPSTGAITLEADFPQFTSYQASSCSFDQISSSMVFILGVTSGVFDLRLYNTFTNVLTNGILPGSYLYEFECDNSQFARLKYGATAVNASIAPASIMTYPNPAVDVLHLDTDMPVESIYITDAIGRSMQVTANGSQVDVSALAPGCYLLIAKQGDGQWARSKFIKQ